MDKGDHLLLAEIGDPLPGKPALHADHQVFAAGCDERQQVLGSSLDVLVYQDSTVVVQDADVERAGMQIDAAVMHVRLGVESH
jgi:hypothetical protein